VSERSAVESKLELVRKRIAEDLALCPDAERAARHAALVSEVAAAESKLQTATTSVDALRLSAPDPAEIERRQMRCERLEQALENRNDELRQLEREIGRLTGQIQTAGGEGVGETLAGAQEHRALAERECARVEERVAMLQLLRDTVMECLTEGREHYYAPVRRHLRPFLNDLFPGAELELGDDFAITGIKRERTEGRVSRSLHRYAREARRHDSLLAAVAESFFANCGQDSDRAAVPSMADVADFLFRLFRFGRPPSARPR
jgi:HAMP domain-containing protein